MKGVPKDIKGFSRIIGLNLAKKTSNGYILTEEMDSDGSMRFITVVVKEENLIAMGGGMKHQRRYQDSP